jgi:hypothetical protein
VVLPQDALRFGAHFIHRLCSYLSLVSDAAVTFESAVVFLPDALLLAFDFNAAQTVQVKSWERSAQAPFPGAVLAFFDLLVSLVLGVAVIAHLHAIAALEGGEGL